MKGVFKANEFGSPALLTAPIAAVYAFFATMGSWMDGNGNADHATVKISRGHETLPGENGRVSAGEL